MYKSLFNFLIVGMSLTGIQAVSAGKPTLLSVERNYKETPRTLTRIQKPDNLKKKTSSPAHFFAREGVGRSTKRDVMGRIILWEKEDHKIENLPSRIPNAIRISIEKHGTFLENLNGIPVPCHTKTSLLKDFNVSALHVNKKVIEISKIVLSFHD